MFNSLVCLHGFAGGPGDWSDALSMMKNPLASRHVLLPNLYLENTLSPKCSMSQWVEAFDNWLLANGAENPLVVGYSMGARLALNWLVQHGGRSHSAVVAISARPGVWQSDAIAKRLQFDSHWANKFRSMDHKQLNEQWQALPVFENTKKSELPTNIDRELLALSFENWTPAKHLFSEQQLLEVYDKVHWIFGGRDKVYQPVVEPMALREGNSVYVVEQAGHRVLKDRPEEVAQIVDEIYTSHQPRP
jgi:2-succinyl-6-hydroxy-2,4-cyclohexadiene-1-carboxylate synthase